MESIFTESIANIVQQISLVLESVGLMLAFIELRHPETAREWERKLDQAEQICISIGRSFIPDEIIPSNLDTGRQTNPTAKQTNIAMNFTKFGVIVDIIFFVAMLFDAISFSSFILIIIFTS